MLVKRIKTRVTNNNMRNPEDTKYVWDEKNFNTIQKSITKEEKRYFIEVTIKDSDTLEPVRSVFTSSDYPESLFTPPVDHRIGKEVNGCLGILFSVPLNKK